MQVHSVVPTISSNQATALNRSFLEAPGRGRASSYFVRPSRQTLVRLRGNNQRNNPTLGTVVLGDEVERSICSRADIRLRNRFR